MAFCSTSNLENTRPWNQSVLGQGESKLPGNSFRVEQAIHWEPSQHITAITNQKSNASNASFDIAFTSLSFSRGETGRLGMVALLAFLHQSYVFNGKCLRLPKKPKNRMQKNGGPARKKCQLLILHSVSRQEQDWALEHSDSYDSSRSCHWSCH